MPQAAELGLSEAQVSYGRFEEAEAKLEWEEGVAREVRGRRAMQRLQGQTRMMVNAEMSRKAQERCVCMCGGRRAVTLTS